MCEKGNYYLDLAEAVAKRSHCVSMSVGCVLVKDDHIISTGINGTPSGYKNCSEHFPNGKDDTHHEWSQKFEIHSEMNALLRCETSTKGATAYITHSPCFNCMKHMVAAGVKKIVYRESYYRMTTKELLELKMYAWENSVEFIWERDLC